MSPAKAPTWAPAEVDLTRPSVARMYDYFLGGSHNFAIDRAMAEQAIAARPEIPALALASRSFLHRTVRHLAGAGIRQFLDIGSGIPSAGNVHEIVGAIRPDAAVVYVDIDPVAVAHARVMLADLPRVGAVEADLCDPRRILDAPEVRDLLDFTEPIAVLLVSVLHFVSDAAGSYPAVAALRDAVPPGSHLVISYGLPSDDAAADARLGDIYARANTPGVIRDLAAVRRFFDGWQLLDPGLVPVPEWGADPAQPNPSLPANANFVGGVAVRP